MLLAYRLVLKKLRASASSLTGFLARLGTLLAKAVLAGKNKLSDAGRQLCSGASRWSHRLYGSRIVDPQPEVHGEAGPLGSPVTWSLA